MRVMMAIQEKRKMERFELRIFSKIRLKSNWHNIDTIELNTKNICANGAYFKTSNPLPVGTPVSLSMKLEINSELKPTSNLMSVEVSGKVIRSEKDGMAIRFENSYKMMPLGNKMKKKKS